MVSEMFNHFERPRIQESGFEVTLSLQSGACISEVSVHGIRILSGMVQYQTSKGVDIWVPKYRIFKHEKDAKEAIRIVAGHLHWYLHEYVQKQQKANESRARYDSALPGDD